jgi:hypothetical protein
MLTALARVVDAVEGRQLRSATMQEIADFRRDIVPERRRLEEYVNTHTPRENDMAYRFYNNKLRRFLALHPNFDPEVDGHIDTF